MNLRATLIKGYRLLTDKLSIHLFHLVHPVVLVVKILHWTVISRMTIIAVQNLRVRADQEIDHVRLLTVFLLRNHF
jgi:hypothetical protein